MIGRIVITSVPQGIDGGTGFQPVLRTQGLQPSIAKRLALRASYPHPYDFGDARNPRVLFHRIETVGDRSIHILGSVRDAGSSYTGRSNHLAELIAIDPAEIRGLPGGPVFACRTFPWLGNWAGKPREVPIAEEPGVPANDPDDPAASGRSEPCVAWTAATGDAGWAGELAQSFLDGRRAVVWVNEGVDAAALFAEAMRLLPVSSRWQVEFNTCEIEPFPAHWRALRPDIMLVGPRPGHGGELVLNLSNIKRNSERSPDHALAHRARGESTARASTVGTHGTQTAGTWPTGGQGFSETPAGTTTTAVDEAAIRERLKEIRESRQRRSPRNGVLPRVEQAPGGLGVWSILFLVGIIVLCGFLMSVSIVAVQYPERARALVDHARAIVGIDGGKAADESSIGLRTHTETTDLLAKKKKEMEEQAARKKADEEAIRLAEAQKRERDEAEKERRKQEMAASERVEGEKREAAAKTTEEAKVAAIKDFTSVAEIKTIPLTQTFPEKVLCPFDAEHLRDAACDLAYIRPDRSESATVRMSVERSHPADGQPTTWTVTGEQFDALSQKWGTPITVCRLAVRDRMLWIEWPNSEISQEHNLFHAIENGAVIVSCKTAAGDAEIRREIRLAEPIDLAASGTAEITLDPLAGDDARAGKDDAQFGSGLAARLKVIEPSALRWSLEVTHPQWSVTEYLRTPDTHLTVQLPSKPLPGVAIEYLDFDAKSKSLVKRASSDIRLEATLTFSRQEARLKLDSEITGLDTVPLLKSVITMQSLRDAFRENQGLDPLKANVKRVLEKCRENERYRVLALDAFLQGLSDEKKFGITNAVSFVRREQELKQELNDIKVPGAKYPGPNGFGLFVYEDKHEYQTKSAAWNKTNKELRGLEDAFNAGLDQKTHDDANAVATALETNKTWFAPITVKIQSLEAVATDSKGKEYKISIVTTPKK
jgi:hypothetical protein